jgi:hypothetical protein
MKTLMPLWLLPFLLAILTLLTAGWIECVPVQPASLQREDTPTDEVEPALRAGSARAERGLHLKPAAGP